MLKAVGAALFVVGSIWILWTIGAQIGASANGTEPPSIVPSVLCTFVGLGMFVVARLRQSA